MFRPSEGVPIGGWLSADELARRAELAARPDVPEAFDSDCPCCVAMRRTCANHVELYQRPELAARIAEVEAVLARSSECEACEGRGKVWEAEAGRWRACRACNAPPAYPGMVPGGLAARAHEGAMARAWRMRW